MAAAERRREYKPEHEMSAYEAVTFAKRSITERLAVFDHFQLVSEALKYGRGYVRVREVEPNIGERRDAAPGKSPEFITVQHGRPNAPGRQYTTREMVAMEREVLQLTTDGRGKVEPIAKMETAESLRTKYRKLNGGLGINAQQAQAAAGILTSPDRVTGLQGVAGSGKTSSTLKIVTGLCEGFASAGSWPGANRSRPKRVGGCRYSSSNVAAVSHAERTRSESTALVHRG